MGGGDEYSVLELIVTLLGTPEKADVVPSAHPEWIKYLFNSIPGSPIPRPNLLDKFFSPESTPSNRLPPSDLAMDLLGKMLAFNPAKRISAKEALKHSYFEEMVDPDEEYFTEYREPFSLAFEAEGNDRATVQRQLWEGLAYVQSVARKDPTECDDGEVLVNVTSTTSDASSLGRIRSRNYGGSPSSEAALTIPEDTTPATAFMD
eukprot:NODE_6618_length_832_cov_86.970381_g6382_i0.p1 GENE.NODE_6618_length_832_cov_86.970381_g6382_i0~~NODE_6618_length_832_cov_86.970381_g6382_i0.p1  ORF type:complete len:205 (+),score=36.57 NODE_6618_length_832_cov_86.970381_g6382_i0:92-706(+)